MMRLFVALTMVSPMAAQADSHCSLEQAKAYAENRVSGWEDKGVVYRFGDCQEVSGVSAISNGFRSYFHCTYSYSDPQSGESESDVFYVNNTCTESTP
jgi:hypothetical protein